MAIERVREYFEQWRMQERIIEFSVLRNGWILIRDGREKGYENSSEHRR